MSACRQRAGRTARRLGPPCVTEVAKYARPDKEVIATVAYMVNSGRVRLCGNFKGARFDLNALTDDVAA